MQTDSPLVTVDNANWFTIGHCWQCKLIHHWSLLTLQTALLAMGHSHSRVLWLQKLKTYLLRTQSSRVLPLKPEAGKYIAMHAMLTAKDSLLISILPVHLPAFFSLPKPLPGFSCFGYGQHQFLCGPTEWNRSPCSSLQTIDAGSHVECPWSINRFQNMSLFFWFGISILWIWFQLSDRDWCALWNIKCVVLCCTGFFVKYFYRELRF